MPADHRLGTVLITGAAKRIGRAIALDLAKTGWKVAIHFRRSQAEADAVVAEIKTFGGEAAALPGDLANAADVRSLIPRCRERLGDVTCTVNNASEFQPDAISETDVDLWDRHQDINLRAPIFLAQSMLQHLPEGHNGNVINIIDQRVWKLTPEFFSYTISKAGLWTATRTLAQALAPRIRVNAIGPGPVLQSVHQTGAEFAAEVDSTLLKHHTTPEEIAAAVRFILGAPSLTGQMIALDGGQHLSWAASDPQAFRHVGPKPGS